jgi:hypothetical protein
MVAVGWGHVVLLLRFCALGSGVEGYRPSGTEILIWSWDRSSAPVQAQFSEAANSFKVTLYSLLDAPNFFRVLGHPLIRFQASFRTRL